jgi:hypothetical protein
MGPLMGPSGATQGTLMQLGLGLRAFLTGPQKGRRVDVSSNGLAGSLHVLLPQGGGAGRRGQGACGGRREGGDGPPSPRAHNLDSRAGRGATLGGEKLKAGGLLRGEKGAGPFVPLSCMCCLASMCLQ